MRRPLLPLTCSNEKVDDGAVKCKYRDDHYFESGTNAIREALGWVDDSLSYCMHAYTLFTSCSLHCDDFFEGDLITVRVQDCECHDDQRT